jgi:hypothetical protein
MAAFRSIAFRVANGSDGPTKDNSRLPEAIDTVEIPYGKKDQHERAFDAILSTPDAPPETTSGM